MIKIIFVVLISFSNLLAFEAYLNSRVSLSSNPTLSNVTCKSLKFSKVDVLKIQWSKGVAQVRVLTGSNCDKNSKYFVATKYLELKK